MKKTELYTWTAISTYMYDWVSWIWADWYEKEFGKAPKYPKDFEYNIEYAQKFMRVRANGEDYKVPLELFYDDEDQQPDLRMMWADDYYDGPLSGMALYEGELVYFHCEVFDGPGDVRIFGLYKLSDEDKREELLWHKRFRDKVGKHFEYGDNAEIKVLLKGVKRTPFFFDFWEEIKKRPERHYEKTNEFIGLFHECQFDLNGGRKKRC